MTTTRRQFVSSLPTSLICLQIFGGSVSRAQSPTSPQSRLGVARTDWSSLSLRRQADPDLNQLVLIVLEQARKDIPLALLERKLEGKRLLSVSREFIRRSLQWAFAFKVTGEKAFLDRARKELLNTASFNDWHPAHFLDVAEMTMGISLAYDWLYDDLSELDRMNLRAAIVNKGIAQARYGHQTFKTSNNWNQVCIGGMVVGALAVEADQPELAIDLMTMAKKYVGNALGAYGPDGVYPEGPGYWDYGTCYSVILAAALQQTHHTDWGILNAPGFKRSAEFYAHAIGPSGKTFNFADGGEGSGFPCALVYLARQLRQPALLKTLRQSIQTKRGTLDRFAPLSALWWPSEPPPKSLPVSFVGQGEQPVAMWRSSWSDPNGLWFAIKGGGAGHNHAHMDAGSFVLDLDGVRWAKDLGMQSYNSLESKGIDLWNMSQNSQRWQVFRLSAQGHNTLTLNDQAHHAKGMASLRMLTEREVLIDLTPALLLGQVGQVTRQAKFTNEAVQLTDQIRGAKRNTLIRWAMNTEANVHIEGNSVVLMQQGKRLLIQFEGKELQLSTADISSPKHDFDAPNPNVKQVIVTGHTNTDGSWTLGARFSRGA